MKLVIKEIFMKKLKKAEHAHLQLELENRFETLSYQVHPLLCQIQVLIHDYEAPLLPLNIRFNNFDIKRFVWKTNST